jgi:hypothetical protein
MQDRFSTVWYLPEDKFNANWRWLNFSDWGSLSLVAGGLHYQGNKHQFSAVPIRRMLLVPMKIPRYSLILSIILPLPILCCTTAPLLLNVLVRDRYSTGSPASSFDPTIIIVAFIVFLAMFLVGTVIFSIYISKQLKWIEVEYLDAQNQAQRVYFADGSFLGWSGIFGGTSRMYQVVERHLMKGG